MERREKGAKQGARCSEKNRTFKGGISKAEEEKEAI